MHPPTDGQSGSRAAVDIDCIKRRRCSDKPRVGERRRQQNRLAQRNYRLREATKAIQYDGDVNGNGNAIEPQPQPGLFTFVARAEPTGSKAQKTSIRKPCGATFAASRHSLISTDHQLLTLVHNNIARGLVINAGFLGYPWVIVCQEESLSSFCTFPIPAHPPCPSTLQPTALQRATTHHPWLDLIPSARFRDNILRAMPAWSEDVDLETELCEDLTGVGTLQRTSGRPGMIVWGENAWEVGNWEVTDEFAMKWAETLRECWDLVAATNYWRRKRGESLLLLHYESPVNQVTTR